MGCDIHAFLEIRVDGEWLAYAEADIIRQYDLFARMADVRNDGTVESVSSPRGLPDNLSKLVRLHRERWGVDGHSDSYLSFDELCSLYVWAKKKKINLDRRFTFLGIYLFGNGVETWKTFPDDYPSLVDDVRLVFWFDN